MGPAILVTGAVIIPKAMAYAFLGSSRVLSVSTTTIAILTGAQLAIVAPGGNPAVMLPALAQQVSNPSVYVLGRKRGTNVFRPLSAENADDETFPGLLQSDPIAA